MTSSGIFLQALTSGYEISEFTRVTFFPINTPLLTEVCLHILFTRWGGSCMLSLLRVTPFTVAWIHLDLCHVSLPSDKLGCNVSGPPISTTASSHFQVLLALPKLLIFSLRPNVSGGPGGKILIRIVCWWPFNYAFGLPRYLTAFEVVFPYKGCHIYIVLQAPHDLEFFWQRDVVQLFWHLTFIFQIGAPNFFDANKLKAHHPTYLPWVILLS